MKVFITGGGLLGASSARHFAEQGHACIVLDRLDVKAYVDLVAGTRVSFLKGDIRDVNLIDSLLSCHRPDVVIHTAAMIGKACETDLTTARAINVTASLDLIERSNFYGVGRFVFASSLAVYDFDDPERMLDEDAPKTKNDVYGLWKLEVEDWIRNMMPVKSMQFTLLRFSGLYGYCPGFGEAWMCAQIARIIDHLESKVDTSVILDGAELGWNEYLYCEDAAAAVVASAFCEHSLCCNVGSGQIISPATIAAAFNKLYPIGEVIYVTPSGPMPLFKLRQHPLPIKLANNYLNWHPSYDIISGLKRTINWYRSSRTLKHALFN